MTSSNNFGLLSLSRINNNDTRWHSRHPAASREPTTSRIRSRNTKILAESTYQIARPTPAPSPRAHCASRAQCAMPHPPELQAQLLNEYNLLDTSLILAISADYDLSDPSEFARARQDLDALQETVSTDEATGFDPSGASGSDGLLQDTENSRRDDESVSARSAAGGWKSHTDSTSQSQDPSYIDLEGLDYSDNYILSSGEQSPENECPSELDQLDEDAKERALIAIFPSLKPYDIKWTLKKVNGDASKAIDELMTQSFLEESGSRQRGVEAFSESDLPARPRKGKKKRKQAYIPIGQTTDGSPISPTESKWDTARQDIDFIVDRTGIPKQQVASIYHNNGASMSTTITAIMQAHASIGLDSDDPMIQLNASELHQDFPTLSISDLELLVEITQLSVTKARDLAKALAAPKKGKKPTIQLDFRHPPLKLDTEVSSPKPLTHNAINPNIPLTTSSASEMASQYTLARNTAFTKASAAYRKGKSDHLMGAAAAYYSEQGRDYDFRAKSAFSAAADHLVSQQSSRTQMDLHGVNVKDGIRIAREGVTRWWHELGENKAKAGRGIGSGYRIVVGRGTHSEGGRSKLGPAVGKMLIREGWKVEVGSTALTVVGVVIKRK